MQQIQYFKSAWGDIKNSPGWFGKLCLLSLLSIIPVFGPIVVYGYLYGWAREIAWGTHEPMPERIFGNEDGKLYRRGWFILVLLFVASAIPYIVMRIGSGMQGAGFLTANGSHLQVNAVLPAIGVLVYLIGLIGGFLLDVLAWIGSMRISIYDRLSAGFQVGKIWKMLRHDTNGILRIFGMCLLFGLIFGIILTIIVTVIITMVIAVGVAGLASSGYSFSSLSSLSETQALVLFAHVLGSAGFVGVLGVIIAIYICMLATIFVDMLVARAMGYWTLQFDVPRWRGQDDPMPFETAPPSFMA